MNRMVGNSQLIQKVNRLKVLNYIRRNPDVARPAVARQTGLSVASLTNITTYLLDKGLIAENGTETVDRVGRKGTLLRFRADAYGLICVFLNMKSVNIAYTDLEGGVIANIVVDTDSLKPQEFIDTVHESISFLVGKYDNKQILGIEIAISGLVLDGSRFVLSSSLKWTEFNLKEELENETGIPVFIDNVSDVKAVWYFHSEKQNRRDNMLMVDLENGIGACQYYNGEINRAMIGEIGHTTVEKDGEPCFCGNRGCLEAMCSVPRILQLYADYCGSEMISSEELVQKLENGDKNAIRAAKECSQYLGIGLANLVNLCKPYVIAINTGGEKLLSHVIKFAVPELKRRAYPVLLEDLNICEVSISEEDAMRGAAFNLCDRLFDLSFEGSIVD